MLGQHAYVEMPPYLWMMFGCPLYIHNTKKACFVRLRGVHMPPYMWIPPEHQQHKESMLCQTKGVSICPHTFECPHMFGCPLYVWMPPVCLDDMIYLDALHMFGCPTVCLDTAKCMVASKGMRHQNIWGCPNIQGHLNIWGHPNVWRGI